MKTMIKFFVLAVMVTILAVSCGKKADGGGTATVAVTSGDFVLESTGAVFTLEGTPIALAGVTFTPPKEWTDFGPSGMRKASYAFGPKGDETDSSTVTVFYFGEGGGGTIQANLDRWVGQMSMPEGVDPHTFVQKGEAMVGEMKAHLLKVGGIYNAGGMMSGGAVTKDNYLMVGVVLEAPEGNIFFKLTGPEASANEMAEGLLGMVQAIK